MKIICNEEGYEIKRVEDRIASETAAERLGSPVEIIPEEGN